jgi:hypothetical protein
MLLYLVRLNKIIEMRVLGELQSPALRFGDGSQSASDEELSPPSRFGDALRSMSGEGLSVLMPSILD